MYPPIRDYESLLADIKRQISMMKGLIGPEAAQEFACEVTRHLNQVVADIMESARLPDSDTEWSEDLEVKIDAYKRRHNL